MLNSGGDTFGKFVSRLSDADIEDKFLDSDLAHRIFLLGFRLLSDFFAHWWI